MKPAVRSIDSTDLPQSGPRRDPSRYSGLTRRGTPRDTRSCPSLDFSAGAASLSMCTVGGRMDVASLLSGLE